jgi:hypothetical protein
LIDIIIRIIIGALVLVGMVGFFLGLLFLCIKFDKLSNNIKEKVLIIFVIGMWVLIAYLIGFLVMKGV